MLDNFEKYSRDKATFIKFTTVVLGSTFAVVAILKFGRDGGVVIWLGYLALSLLSGWISAYVMWLLLARKARPNEEEKEK